MKVNVFLPEYMVDFKCIGSECTDTCCAGWDINIDKDTFEHYENSNNELNELVKDKYRKNEYDHDFFNEGFMILKDKKRCPFLNENNLCDIHGNIGEEHLCVTCTNYPRVFNIVDDVYEKSGITSCEEICLRALLNKEKMEFVESTEDINEDKIEIRRIIDTESFEGTDSLLQYFWDIRVISINILQNRKYRIEKRLNILKYFYSKIETLAKEENFEEIEETLEEFNDEETNFDNYSGEYFNNEYDLYCKLKGESLIQDIKGERLKKCIEEYISGLNKIEFDSNINEYINAKSVVLKQLEKYDYIFENYLVNAVFKDLIPFNKGESLSESINELINVYEIIKAYIIGISFNCNGGIGKKEVIRVIQALSKDIEHNKVFDKIKSNI